MGDLGEGFKLANWATQRIDQVSKFFKKKGRENEVKKIDTAVNTGTGLGSIVQSIKKNRNKRTDE